MNHPEGGGLHNTSSCLIRCPFKLTAYRSKESSEWHINATYPYHNHDATAQQDLSGHSHAHHLTDSQKEEIASLATSSMPTRKIQTHLAMKASESGITFRSTNRDIQNVINKVKDAKLAGQSSINAFLDDLEKNNATLFLKKDAAGHVTHLFFTLPDTIEMTKTSHQILLLDSTYKTNHFSIPLLHVVGCSSTYKSFSSCFVFMRNEKTEDYLWAIQCMLKADIIPVDWSGVALTDSESALISALEETFPLSTHLLCGWHISIRTCLRISARPFRRET